MSDVDVEILEPESNEEREKRVRNGFWATFKRAARKIPFSEDLVAAYYCALDENTPSRVRAILLGALGYFVLPIDVIPDMVLGAGFTDDATVLLAAITAVRSHITDDHRAAARRALREVKENEADKSA